MSEDEGMDLNGLEVEAVAALVVAQRVSDVELWLEWEDYPNLGEYAFQRLVSAVQAIGRELHRASRSRDRHLDIDSQDLLERAW